MIVVNLGFGAVLWAAPTRTDRIFNQGDRTQRLADLVNLYETSTSERSRLLRKLGLNPQLCRSAKSNGGLSNGTGSTEAESSKRLVLQSSKLKLQFLIEDLKKAQKPRSLDRSALRFLSEIDDCSALAEEIVTLSLLSDNWDLQVSGDSSLE